MPAPEDLAMFCGREHPRLVGALTLYCGDRLLAEEIAQEALVRTCERWTKVRQLTAPGAWTHRVAMNLAKSRFRRRALERRVAERTSTDGVAPETDAATAVAVRQAVAQLAPRQREAIVLRHYAGMSVEEAAAAMKVSSGALRSLTHRATQQLESLLALDTDTDTEVHHAG